MCKTKMNVKEPIPLSSRKSYQKSSSLPSTSSTSNPSTSTTSNAFSSDNNHTNTSSESRTSRSSLKSLKDSLPETTHIYDFSEIRKATNNFLAKRFSSSSSSSSASVWKCLIRGKDVIIFQRKFHRSIDSSKLRERLTAICKSHHISLIKLLGASVSGDYIYLVYEYVNGGNLRDCLRNSRNPEFTVLSTWMSRMQITADVAQGIEYIHHFSGLDLALVHNHIKSSSVIVTEPSFNAKICHFGTSELCGEISENREVIQSSVGEIQEEIQSLPSSSKMRRSKSVKFTGTNGYMSPEYQRSGIATQKSDVYAFGVVILELLSGEEPVKFKLDQGSGQYRSVSVIETAKEAIESEDFEKIRRWIDRRLKDSFPVDIAERLTRVALECVHAEADKRPDMRRVSVDIILSVNFKPRPRKISSEKFGVFCSCNEQW
ncbi:PTI1-like tyrosine-protein kinase 1 isoform X1 [Papaver somniferum]|uniref:PTI1-like tyrosine-protein kinase 1 isoform X1 n=1 Tax=Papaver somniferum TaxID=3469 RepID=UPI000E6F64F4|nr:PTI1-like tyrosine-protein kinase 1 isoform X1 [Papaver somniferum]